MISTDPQLIKNIVSNGERLDGRGMYDYRKITIEKGAVATADGSARVKLGNTEVICGVKFSVGEPFSDTPDEGVLMVAAEFVPLASPEFESGPPGEEAVEASRVVDRAIRESKVIDFKKLCITPGEKVWMVFVDIDVLDNDGNLIDAASLAAIAALFDAKLPGLKEDGKIDYDNKSDQGLQINGIPLSTTFAKVGDSIIADPDLSEAEAVDARLTVGTFDKDGDVLLCSMQKGGSVGLTVEELEKIIDLAISKGKELRKMVANA
ncbi:MAG: exosome complex protein Rrp42 [Candidatus Aenigmarchaeota archaeon]|nr:exosome complex protein Rrp42 [Candidatus Aenigmarchaeota archaeon]